MSDDITHTDDTPTVTHNVNSYENESTEFVEGIFWITKMKNRKLEK